MNINTQNVSQAEEALILAKNDIISFGKLFLPDDFMRSETPFFHYEMADFIDDKEIYRQYEHDFYKVEYAISQFNDLGLPDPKRFKVDFSEVEYPMTVQDQIMRDEFDLAHNLTTEAKLMVRDNKDLSLKEAQKVIDDNRGVNEQGNQQGLFNQLRQGA